LYNSKIAWDDVYFRNEGHNKYNQNTIFDYFTGT
jgi:hypothetical protein